MLHLPTNIVSTRKISADLIKLAAENGIQIIDFDFLNYEYIFLEKLVTAIANNKVPLVFTSQHAVYSLLQLINKSKIKLQNKTCFTIDGITKSIAVENGFKVLDSATNSVQLAHKIIEQNITEILFCCGNIRLNYLHEIVSKNKIIVTELELYNKILSSIKIENDFDAVLFFSPSQIDSFFVKNNLPIDTPAFCIGNTTGDYLKSKKHVNCIVANNQSVKSVIETAITYFEKQQQNRL